MKSHFRIVSWNCAGALRKKLHVIDTLNADVLVIQECEDPSRSTVQYREWAGNHHWVGDNKNKGLGVFSKCEQPIQKLGWSGSFTLNGLLNPSASHSWSTQELKLFLPVKIGSLTLLAVWTKGSEAQAFGYVGQLWKYLHIHGADIANAEALVVGDWNSNAIWDKPDRLWNHSDVAHALYDLGLESLYHHQRNEPQGQESTPTFYMHRKAERPYHIDYAFLPRKLLGKAQLHVGNPNEWLEYSDHMPVVIDIEITDTKLID